MFMCVCGGVLLVKEISKYPSNLTSSEQLEHNRRCTVECADCGKVIENQPYDSDM